MVRKQHCRPLNRSIAEDRVIARCAFAHAMRAYTHRRPSARARCGPSIEDFPKPSLASVLPATEWRPHPARRFDGQLLPVHGESTCSSDMTHRQNRPDERLDPCKSGRGSRSMPAIRTRESFRAGGATVVHDVQGPIVTGVLGGD
jgi:hypothetical protein